MVTFVESLHNDNVGPTLAKSSRATCRTQSLEDRLNVHDRAIENAIARASKTTRHLRWFEVTQQRGEIHDGEIQHYQVTMKVGFTLED